MLFKLHRFKTFLAVILLGFALFLSAGGSPALAAQPPEPAHHGPVGVVQVGPLNIRSGPGLDYSVIARVNQNDTLGLTGRSADSGWLRVRLPLNGQEGWAMTRYIDLRFGSIYDLPVVDGGSPAPPPTGPAATVMAPRLNVRGGPGLTYDIIATLGRGDVQPLVGRSSDGRWLQIQISSPYPTFAVPTGWVMAQYVWSSVPVFQLPVTDGGTLPPPPDGLTGVVTVPTLNVRSGPGLAYSVSNRLNGGQTVKLLGRTQAADWLKVEWSGYSGGSSGWVMARYIRAATPVANLPVIGDQPAARRIHFPPGSSSAVRWSSLPPNGIDTYVLRAMAGQTMTVKVSPVSGQALLSISGANGEVLKSAGAGSSSWSGTLPLTQDYFLTISAPGGSAMNYTLQVTIPPR